MINILISIMIYGAGFTFDDGPSTKYTPQILDILKKYKIKAVFCWPSSRLYGKRLKIAKRALKEGHILCNHSVTHPEFNKLSRRKQIAQIVKAQKTYKKKLNYVPKYFRPPHGIITRTMRRTVKRLGMKMLLWNIDTKDWYPKTTSYRIYRRTITKWKKRRKKGKNSIILFHDVKRKTARILEKIILYMKKNKKFH